jgi:hypothetical protein
VILKQMQKKDWTRMRQDIYWNLMDMEISLRIGTQRANVKAT